MKRTVVFAGLMLAAFFAFAEEGIYLPDLTTVVEDSSEVFVPELELSITAPVELPYGTVSIEVVLPEEEEPVVEIIPEKQKLGLQGNIGAGYPGNFHGNILFNSVESSEPYHLAVNYDTWKNLKDDGFAKGFYNRNFSVAGGKMFSLAEGKGHLNLNGAFRDLENGFQNISGTSYSRTDYTGKIDYLHILPKGFHLSASLTGDVYNRSVSGLNDTLFGFVSPEFGASWAYKDFCISLNGNYSFEEGNKNKIHRGYTGLEMMWQNNYVMLLGNVGAVFGNHIGSQDVLVPFTLNTTVRIPVKSSENEVVVSLEGGMSSEGKSAAFMEQTCDYSMFELAGSGVNEVSDWFGILDFYLPIRDFFTLNMNVEYHKTAFGNGFIQPDYSPAGLGVSNLYGFQTVDRQLIHTREDINLKLGKASMSFGWESFFDFVPSVSPEQSVYVDLAYEAEKWDVYGNCVFPVISVDSTPNLSLEGSVKLNSALRIALNVEDTVKLINGKSRLYAGQYASRSGSVSLMVKFIY